MRTLVRYSVSATYSIYFGTFAVLAIAFNSPWSWREQMQTVVVMWFALCALWCPVIWVSAAFTPEGRSSAAPWVSGVAVMVKLVTLVTLLGDNITRLFSRSVDGRPLRVGGEVHRTACAPGDDWSRGGDRALCDEPELVGVDWAKRAGDEHASIAAFSRLALDLLAAGAPPELVAGAHRAALEEIEHAQLCFRLASLQACEPLTAAPLAAAAPSRAKLAVESLVDGCVNERIAARGLERLSAKTRTPWLAEALARVARDEHGHARLAEQVVAWCLR